MSSFQKQAKKAVNFYREGFIKIVGIIIAIFFVGISIGLLIKYNQSATHAVKNLEQERYLRMSAEENLEKANTRMSSLESELKKETTESEMAIKDLEALKSSANDYRARLDEAAEINKNLDNKIKELQNIVAPAPVLAPATN